MKRSAVFFICFFLSAQPLFSQLMPYTQYTVKDGLPSSNIYCIAQDSVGFIWLGTDNGLCRFDGYEFETVGNKNSRDEITSLGINKSQIIYGSYKKQIVFSDYYGEKTSVLNSDNFYSYDRVLEYGKYIIILNKGHNIIIKNKVNNKVIYDSFSAFNDSSNYPISISNFESTIYIASSKGINKINLNEPNLIEYNILKTANNITALHCVSDTIIYYCKSDSIFKLNNLNGKSKLVHVFNIDDFIIKQLDIIRGELFVLSSFPTNLYKLPIGQNIPPERIILESDFYINSFFIDSDGSIWLGTKQNGLIRLDGSSFLRYHQVDTKPLSVNKIIKTNMGSEFFSTSHGVYIRSEYKTFAIPLSENSQEYIRSVSQTSDSIIISVIDPKLTGGIDKFRSLSYSTNRLVLLPASCAIKYNSDTLIVGNWQSEISYIKLNGLNKKIVKLFTVRISHHQRNRITDIKTLRSELIVSSESGTYRVSSAKKISLLNKRKIIELKYLNDSTLAGICNRHLVIITPDTSKEIPLTRFFGSINFSFNSVCYYDNQWWFGTNKGIYIYNNSSASISRIGYEHGVPTENINYIKFDSLRNTILAGAESYVLYIDPNKFFIKDKHIDVKFVSLFSKHRLFYPLNKLTLRSHDRKLKIKYVAFNLTNPYAVSYRYRIDNKDWVITNSREIEFNNLEYGNHEFSISASVYGGEWGDHSNLSFYIKPPFWQTAYFYMICSLLIIGSVYHTSKSRFSSLKYSSEYRLSNQYQLESLKQQVNAENLNPHFVFNALNSIKEILKTKHLSLSLGYIDKFSKLIRINLSSSTDSTVRLFDELSRVKYYLDLEKLRLEIPFEYEINIADDIDPKSTWIPNMIIQPLVENIIWHGFLEPVKEGRIQINLKRRFSGIELSVIDNGIGIKESKKRMDKTYKSKGMELVLAQLMTIDPFASNPISTSDANKGYDLPGTKVEIRLTTKMISSPS